MEMFFFLCVCVCVSEGEKTSKENIYKPKKESFFSADITQIIPFCFQ